MNLQTVRQESAVSIPHALVEPRFGTPGDAALFVGEDLFHDFFYFPLSQVAVVIDEHGQRLLTQFEETAEDCARYDFVFDLFELSHETGEVIA